MPRRVAVTGLGILAPSSASVDAFTENIRKEKVFYQKLKEKVFTDLSVFYGGYIEDMLPDWSFGRRFLKKCDRFSHYALHAVKGALQDARLDISQIDAERIGIYVGNSAGGWNSAAEGLYQLHTTGAKTVSPYLASNWFPAAPQGHISIFYGIRGAGKTVTADMASSHIAIGNAYRLIQDGNADYMLAGGVENLFVPWGMIFYQSSGRLYTGNRQTEPYQPFHDRSCGLVLAEGAAFLVLEELETAKKRGVHIYAEITGYGVTNDGAGKNPAAEYARCMRIAADGKTPDVIFLNGCANKKEDQIELESVYQAFSHKSDRPVLTCPKKYYGHAYAAAGAMDAVVACKVIQNGMFYGAQKGKAVSACLLEAKSSWGVNASLAFERLKDENRSRI